MDKAEWFAKFAYRPYPKQWAFHNSQARFRVMVAGRRAGKSLMSARDVAFHLFAPKTRGWIVGPSYSLGEKEFRVLWDDLIIGMKLGRDNRVQKAYSTKQGNMYIEMPWQARVEVHSSDYPEGLVGEGLDWLIVSEAAKHGPDIWERYLRPTLSDKRGQAIFSTTPEGQNWLHKVWQLGQDPDYPQWESWQFPSWENTEIFPGGRQDPEILAVERTTTKEWFDQEYGAQFTAFVGRVFDSWSEAIHVDDIRFNPAWPNYIGFDFGFTNPFSAIEFQVSPQDVVHVWREYYEPGLTLEQHIHAMQTRPQPPGYHLDVGFGDAADPEGCEYLSHHFVNTMCDPAAKKNWRQGVDLIDRFMQEIETGEPADEYGTPKMAPRFYVDHSCKQLIHELNNYRSKPAPRTMYPSDPQDAPLKKDDHGIDALRYALVHLFELGAQHHLEDVAEFNPTMTVQPPIDRPSAPFDITDPGKAAMDELYALMGGQLEVEMPATESETIFNFGSREPVF